MGQMINKMTVQTLLDYVIDSVGLLSPDDEADVLAALDERRVELVEDGIRAGWEDYRAGRTMPIESLWEEFDKDDPA